MGGRVMRWVHGPGPVAAGAFRHIEIAFVGERRILRLQHGERIVYGPWRVTIRGVDPHGRQRILDRWEIHYSWPAEAGGVRVETPAILRRILQGYSTRVVPGGSEARLIGESWASEALQQGASEWTWLAGSEARLAGASELLYLGASEARYLGASESLGQGASESLALGAAELGFGASERLLGGASEQR